jgi:hypothetical protein
MFKLLFFSCHSCTELVEVWFTLPIAIGINYLQLSFRQTWVFHKYFF